MLFKKLFSPFPDWITKLEQLESINLIQCSLPSIPQSIRNLNKLSVRIEINKIGNLPNSIGKLKSLRELGLYNNALNFIPETMKDLENLEYLYLWGNIIYENNESIKQIIIKLGNFGCKVYLNPP